MNAAQDATVKTWFLLVALLALPAFAEDDGLRNWFDDPFFQASADIAGCPLPAGPFTDEAGRREQSHRRAEKGTTCWLAGECDRPKAYAYDREIAQRLQVLLPQRFPATSLWVTVQGRVVYVEGCTDRPGLEREIEALVRGVEGVQQAIAILREDAMGRVPYRIRGIEAQGSSRAAGAVSHR